MAGIKTLTYEIKGWTGLNTLPNIADKLPNEIEDCRNVDFDEEGMIVKRRGCTHIDTFSGTINLIQNFQAVVGFTSADDNQRVLIVAGSTLHVIQYFADRNIRSATFSATCTPHYACSTNNGIAYVSNEDGGVPKMLCYVDGNWIYQSAELNAPAAAPAVGATGSGSFSGNYQAIYTYIDKFGNESNPSPNSDVVALSSQGLAVGVTGSADPTVNQIGIYVLTPVGTLFKFVGTTSNTSSTFSTSVSDTVVESGDEAVYTSYPCPSGRFICIYNDMLIVAGNSVVPDQVYCSNWSFHRQFSTATDYDRVTSNDGQPVRGFGYLYSDLIVGKADSLHIASGADNTVFHTKPYNPDYGVLGQNSILGFQKKMAFYSDDGIYVDAGMIPIEISRKIRTTLRISNPTWLFRRPPRQVSCHYKYYKKLYFAVRLNIATDGNMDSLLVYNYEMDSWTIHNGFEITSLGNAQVSDDYDFMYGGDSQGNIFYFNPPNSINSNDDTIGGVTSSISAYAETAWINLPKVRGVENWERAKTEAMWMMLYAGGEPASGNSTISITTTLYTDFDMTVRATYSTTHKAEPYLSYKQPGLCPVEPKLIQAFGGGLGQFSWIKIRFANANPSEHFKINKVVFGFRVRPGVDE